MHHFPVEFETKHFKLLVSQNFESAFAADAGTKDIILTPATLRHSSLTDKHVLAKLFLNFEEFKEELYVYQVLISRIKAAHRHHASIRYQWFVLPRLMKLTAREAANMPPTLVFPISPDACTLQQYIDAGRL